MFFNVLQDPGRELDRLCSFLGLSPSAEEKNNVLTGAKFDNMKKNKMTNYSTVQIMDQEVSPFMRKGTVKVTGHLLLCPFFPICLSSTAPMLKSYLSILNPHESHDSLTLHRASGRLEEPFYRGPEYRIRSRLCPENEELHASVS